VLLPTAKTAVPLDSPLLPTSVPLIVIEVNALRLPVTEPAPNATSLAFFALAASPIAKLEFFNALESEPIAMAFAPVAFAFAARATALFPFETASDPIAIAPFPVAVVFLPPEAIAIVPNEEAFALLPKDVLLATALASLPTATPSAAALAKRPIATA